MFEVERHHDEVVINYDGWLDVNREGDTSYLVVTLAEARELCEKVLEATLPGSFEFILTSPATDSEDG